MTSRKDRHPLNIQFWVQMGKQADERWTDIVEFYWLFLGHQRNLKIHALGPVVTNGISFDRHIVSFESHMMNKAPPLHVASSKFDLLHVFMYYNRA